MLEIKGLRATAGDTEILKGIDLTVRAGEVHAVMGPNGSGKSTLAQVLAGHPAYQVTGGSVLYQGQDLLELEPEERAQAGIFLAFQYPVEIPGVTNAYFLRAAYNEIRKSHGLEEVLTLVLHRSAEHFVCGIPGEHLRERGLAGAVRSHHGVHLARIHREVDALEDFLIADGGVKIFDFD